MKSILQRLHARMGDFWWYSLMIFMAARAADCLNVFVGLWLVPKYVEPSELGAVMPLTQFASFLAIPIGAFATTFRQELTNLAVTKQFGKLKTLMRGVFIATAIFFFFAIVVSHFVLPHYLVRIRVAEGSLGMLILVFSFISAIAPIFANPLQALKKFKTMTVINLIGAPVRLLAMLVTIPLRALSGYFVGQTSVPAFSIITSLFALRREFKVKAEPYWTRPVVTRFTKLYLMFGFSAIVGAFAVFVETTVLRQRIPEIESAAYYMTTRFSDIAVFVTSTFVLTIFPYTAELAAQKKDTRPLLIKSSAVIVGSNILLASFFWFSGRSVLAVLPNGMQYAAYYWAIPAMIAISTIGSVVTVFGSIEASANRFRYYRWMLPLAVVYPALLLAVTGNGYYIDHVPDWLATGIKAINVTDLASMFWWMAGYKLLSLFFATWDTIRLRPRR